MNKLLEFQKRVEAIKKDSKNPFFKSSYLSLNGLLDAIKPILNDLELTLNQPLTTIDGRPAIATILKDGDSVILQDGIILPDLQDPQKMGSAITYYRRYAIQSMLLLQAEDDDGESVVRQNTPVKKESIDSKKLKITELCKKNGFKGGTAKDYEMFVFGLTGEVLEEKNYDKIITYLQDLTNI